VDRREPIVVFVSTLVVTFVLPLVILLQPQVVKVFLQHAAILKLVVGSRLVGRTRFLVHLVEDGPFRGASRLLVLDHSDKIVIEGLALVLPCFLLVVVIFLGPLLGSLLSSASTFPMSSLWLRKAPTAFSSVVLR